MHKLWKYKRDNMFLSKLDKDVLKMFCDTPVCPSCGTMFMDNKVSYLGAWGSEDSLFVAYRLCDDCGELIKTASYFELLKIERIVENYLKLTHPYIIERIAEDVRTKPIVSSKF